MDERCVCACSRALVQSAHLLPTLTCAFRLVACAADKSTVGRVLGPITSVALRAMIEPVVTSVVILRDFVEQDRFVVRPLSMTSAAEAPSEEPAAPSELERKRAAFTRRTATMLAYRRCTHVAGLQHWCCIAAARSVGSAFCLTLCGCRCAGSRCQRHSSRQHRPRRRRAHQLG